MYNETVETLIGMTASDFNGLSASRKTTAALTILDKPIKVQLYTKNLQTTFPQFTIKTASFCEQQSM